MKPVPEAAVKIPHIKLSVYLSMGHFFTESSFSHNVISILDIASCNISWSQTVEYKNLDFIIARQVRCAEYKMGRRLVRYSLLWAGELWHVPWPGFLYLAFFI